MPGKHTLTLLFFIYVQYTLLAASPVNPNHRFLQDAQLFRGQRNITSTTKANVGDKLSLSYSVQVKSRTDG